ncbi:MAG: hypothetical protein COX79_02180 [Candidatus Levybacteria bacterium CG_4_10_14_0_2_um_filter_36_16]|nr:MAG: hypothetical protein AUK12_02395 [Candidatus Levybacteria bacterium CG2_30_37_29]PIR79329.1 MAG: hypothetical protein COU26_01770 [Candidatus Levybacteria bacterium CG10_big_fil_rev_8_21_14_0_10_36_30]PIZ97536.1 MAG: hypothetical protein COX79_02180 [Candidatus Levybacteria bacterium CG_4_10_14_0_2_um_filter_36_16]
MRKVFILLFAFFLFSKFVPAAMAADEIDIGINPPIFEIATTPPSKVEAKIFLQNYSEIARDFDIKLHPFRQSQELNGTIEYLINDDFYGPDPLIRQKVHFFVNGEEVQKIHLDALEQKTINMQIDLQKDSPIGDYYFSVVFITESLNQASQTSTTIPAGIATNVLLSVGQKGPATGSISEFWAPLFVEHGPVYFKALIYNTSDHFILPNATIIIKNIFGQTVGKIETLPQYILSQTQRYLIDRSEGKQSEEVIKFHQDAKIPSVIWSEKALFGMYTATLQVNLSDNTRPIKKSIVFFAFPLIWVIGISVIFAVILGIYISVRRKITKLQLANSK